MGYGTVAAPNTAAEREIAFRQRLLKCVHSLHSSYHRKNKLVPPITPGGGEEVYLHNVRCWTGSNEGGRNAGRDFYVAGRTAARLQEQTGSLSVNPFVPFTHSSPIRT